MQGLCANFDWMRQAEFHIANAKLDRNNVPIFIANWAVRAADALLAELETP